MPRYSGSRRTAAKSSASLSSGASRCLLFPRLSHSHSAHSYSLGGLVARYVLGLLDSRTPSFFSTVRPVNFTTFASPALGIPQYKSFWSRTFRFLGSRLLSRTGNQLYERDRFLPARFNSGKDDGVKDRKGLSKYLPVVKGREEAEPLLKVLADPRYNFYKALAKFEKIDVFANTCVALGCGWLLVVPPSLTG